MNVYIELDFEEQEKEQCAYIKMDKEEAIKLRKVIILCNICREPATTLDNHYPWQDEYNTCDIHFESNPVKKIAEKKKNEYVQALKEKKEKHKDNIIAEARKIKEENNKLTHNDIFKIAYKFDNMPVKTTYEILENVSIIASGTFERATWNGLKVRQVQKELGLI